jgi:diguanylate cyclase (GGDEF)-like protein
MLLAERVREELEKKAFHVRGDTGPETKGALRVTCSLGVATLPEAGDNWEALFKAADDALYVSKRSGRNRSTAWTRPTGSSTSTTPEKSTVAA